VVKRRGGRDHSKPRVTGPVPELDRDAEAEERKPVKGPLETHDTVGGHLRANWSAIASALGGSAAVLVAVGGAYLGIRDQINEVGRRVDVLQTRVDNHLEWHRTNVGTDRSDAGPEAQLDAGIAYGLLQRGDTEAVDFITAERLSELLELERQGELSAAEQADLRAAHLWATTMSVRFMGEYRDVGLARCESDGFPTQFCRDAYRYNADIEVFFDLCTQEFPRSRCFAHVRGVATEIAPRINAYGVFFRVENGVVAPTPVHNALMAREELSSPRRRVLGRSAL
jgi:hypothetical protein